MRFQQVMEETGQSVGESAVVVDASRINFVFEGCYGGGEGVEG